ncbi:hypothetical protein [Burkholderia ubonensis]|nr:hypothetical protein [Burkholderia ubonensis]
MLTIYSSDHQLHRGVELKDGAISVYAYQAGKKVLLDIVRM